MISWLFEPTRSLWLTLDANVFWAMNGSLNWGDTWQKIWAIANNRAFDLAAAISMLSLFALRALRDDPQQLNRYIAMGLFMFVTLVIAMQIGKALPIERPSATAHFPEALRLTELVPDISTKDYSGDSFPGDHGLVLLICAGFALVYLPHLYALLAALFCVMFTLPRLMSGAHWLTDEIVGAIAVGSFILRLGIRQSLTQESDGRIGKLGRVGSPADREIISLPPPSGILVRAILTFSYISTMIVMLGSLHNIIKSS